jgi:hypothetical protein
MNAIEDGSSCRGHVTTSQVRVRVSTNLVGEDIPAVPFCYVMLDDGVKAQGHENDQVKVADISIHLLDGLDNPVVTGEG